MPLTSRLFAGDEELGKKDDDHVPGQKDLTLDHTLQWACRSVPAPKRRRRLILIGFVVLLMYVVFGGPGGWAILGGPARDGRYPPTGPPPMPESPSQTQLHYYDGPSKYYALAKSLQRATRGLGIRPKNRNVLFVAANLQSLDRLIAMACEMARWNRNVVHVAVMGRHDISMEDIVAINGVDKSCDIMLHGRSFPYATDTSAADAPQMHDLTTPRTVQTNGMRRV